MMLTDCTRQQGEGNGAHRLVVLEMVVTRLQLLNHVPY